MLTRKNAVHAAVLTLLLAGAAAPALRKQPPDRKTPGAQPDGSFFVSTNQAITPVGIVRRTEGVRPKDLALSPDGATVAALSTGRILFFTLSGEPTTAVAFQAGPLGIAWAPDGRTLYASGGDGKVARLVQEGDKWQVQSRMAVAEGRGDPQPAGLAVSPDGGRLYVALGVRNAVAFVDTTSGSVTATVPVGVCPYRVALAADGRTLFVANRGGRRVRAGRGTAMSAGSPVAIDRQTDAARRGTVSIIDTASLSVSEVEVGRQPSGMAATLDGRTLYVANSDSDDVSVVDVPARRVSRTIDVRPADDPGFGQIPTSVLLAEDGRTLYVACGGANAVAVVDLAAQPRPTRYFPTAWFPIALTGRGTSLAVACSKGVGSRPAAKTGRFGVHDNVGVVQFVGPEQLAGLEAGTRKVAQNNGWGPEPAPRPGVAALPVPERVGEPSVFKHVIYVIKENHTYDSTLGDMKEGNGDPSLTMFGEEVTPNQHALARQFVLLDNTYTSGTNSADGHQWTSSSVCNGYMEQNYSSYARSYPFDGGDPLAYSPAGFLWSAAAKRRLGVRVYGEFVNRPRITGPGGRKRVTWTDLWRDYREGTKQCDIRAETDNAALRPFLHPRFIGFPQIVSDQWRADQFLAELAEFERTGRMPALCVMLLPNDHTSGTTPEMPTPRAAVADNDLALGRIVEAVSRSRFWKETLILVMEDDSQFGLDHVDGHRTIAFCVSPYTRRGVVVSEPYTHTSVARTIGLVLGIQPMNRFDRTALPMAACFTATPDLRPYTHEPARIALDEMNPRARTLRGEARRLALASARQDWSDVDRADAAVVARAAWLSQRPGEPFPWRAFHPEPDRD